MKKKFILITLLIIYIVVLVIVGLTFLSKVKVLLVEYEASQPEIVVEKQLKILQEAAKNNCLGDVMLDPEGREDFDWNSDFNKSYVDLIANGKLEYVLSTDYSEDGDIYNIIADGTIVAKMKIVSSNHRNKLYLFNMFDWKHEYTQPVLNFYEVSVSFPDILTVYADGIKQTGTPGENGMIDYYVSSTSPIKLAVEDVYGNKLDIDAGTKVETQSFLFNIPSNFTLKVAGEVVSSEGLEVTPNPDYQYVSEAYPDMPGFVTYEIVCLDTETSRGRFEIMDNLNNPVDFEWDMTTVTLTEQSALDTVPESVLAEVDVMKFAEDFRYYMSADLGSSSKKYGFDKIKEWFIKDSFFYKVVENWFKNVDITFISGHTNLNPVFTDKVMDHYISFGDDCFLVHLSLVQNMKLRDGQYYSDPFDEYCYFVKYDDTDDGKDNPRWVVVDMFSPPVIEEEPEE